MDETTKIASIGVGIAFSIGLLYNYGYFTTLDPNFFTLLSYKDHLTALVAFAAPCLILALMFGVARDKKRGLDYVAGFVAITTITILVNRDGLVTLPRLSAFLRWFVGFASFLLIAYLIAAIVMFFGSDNWRQQSAPVRGLVGLCILALIVFIVVYGNAHAHADVGAGRYELEVTLAGGDKTPSPPRPAHLVRAIDEGLFLVFQDSPDRIAFVRKDEAKMISERIPK